MPNGMYGGVRGQRKSSPTRLPFFLKMPENGLNTEVLSTYIESTEKLSDEHAA